MKSESKKQNFLAGAAILSLSTIIVKVLGMFYKIPLKHLIGDANYGYFSTAYEIYTLLLTISLTGLPVAMSRMISEARALNNGNQVRRIYRTAMMTYLVIGVVCSGVMMLFAKPLASDVMNNPGAVYSIFALGPAVLFICIASACRGFFQGQGNMVPTAVSQVIEALSKLFLGLAFAWIVVNYISGAGPLASGASILGITIGAALSALYLLIARRRSAQGLEALGGTAESTKKTFRTLLSIAVPITIGAAGFQLINVIDSATIMARMLSAAQQVEAGAANIMGRLLEIGRATGAEDYVQEAADIAKGIYNYCQTIFNFPLAFISNIGAAIIPAITNHLTLKNARGIRSVQNSSLRLMGLIAMPCMIGMLVLSEPIMAILGGYSGEKLWFASILLASLSLSIIVTSISNVASAIMQAHNHVIIPVINTTIGGIMKVIFNYILVGNPDIAILGAPVGTFLCFLTIMVLNLFAMRRVLKDPPKVLPNIWRVGLAAILMGAAAYGSYFGLTHVFSGMVIPCFGAIVVAVIVYFLLVILLKAITYEDCLLLPKGEKIARILHIR